jgi:hypothetical protein
MENDTGKRSMREPAQATAASQLLSSAQVVKGHVYFALVFGTGFVLETIRVLCSVPRFGERNEELLEQPRMLIAVVLAVAASTRLTCSPFITTRSSPTGDQIRASQIWGDSCDCGEQQTWRPQIRFSRGQTDC